ncbi:MAG: superoxide dismutase family protein [Opitutales bacterium]
MKLTTRYTLSLFAGLLALALPVSLSAHDHKDKGKSMDREAMKMKAAQAMKHDHGSPILPIMYEEIGAIAVLEATEGNDVEGVIRFLPTRSGVRVVGKVTGLTPGKHGFHIHEYGDRRSADGTSLGGHYNPTGQPHSGPENARRHIGDLGNIVADEDGVAMVDFTDPLLTFSGPYTILGRGLVVHAGEDDLSSQPTGAAGARVAVAVIGVINPDLD